MDVVPLSKLGPAEWQRWRALRAGMPAFESPYFDPNFALAVEAARPGVSVAVLACPDGPAFLPFERRGGVGIPVAFPASDYHGPIAPAGARFETKPLLRSAGLQRFVFNHLVESPATADWSVELRTRSPYMLVGGGLNGYATRREDAKIPDHIRTAQRMGRKLGNLRYEFDCRDPRMLALMIEWKRRQYAATGADDFFAQEWALRLLHECFERREEGFSGVLTAVYSGDTPIALHFGLRSGGVLHSWFPTYDTEFGRYSPGIQLMLYLVEQADALGLSKVDFGRGEMTYKLRLMTGAQPLGEGELDRSAWRGGLRRRARQSWRDLRASRFYDRLRQMKAKVRGKA